VGSSAGLRKGSAVGQLREVGGRRPGRHAVLLRHPAGGQPPGAALQLRGPHRQGNQSRPERDPQRGPGLHARRPGDPGSRAPTLRARSSAWAEPLVLGVPAVETGRYHSPQFIDLYTFNFAHVGSRATGNGAGGLAVGRTPGRLPAPGVVPGRRARAGPRRTVAVGGANDRRDGPDRGGTPAGAHLALRATAATKSARGRRQGSSLPCHTRPSRVRLACGGPLAGRPAPPVCPAAQAEVTMGWPSARATHGGATCQSKQPPHQTPSTCV
jgi:hypothetical protein